VLRAGHVIVLGVLTLLTIGVLMVNSASMSLKPGEAMAGRDSILLSRSALYMGCALVAMALCAFGPVRRVMSWVANGAWRVPGGRTDGLWLLAIGTLGMVGLLLLVYVPGLASPQKGAHRWIAVPGLGDTTFQPSEFAKWGMLALLAVVMIRRSRWMGTIGMGLAPFVLAMGAVLAVIAQEDLGTAVLMACAMGIMLVGSGVKMLHLGALAPLAIAGGAIAVAMKPYRWRRLTTFADPYADVEGAGFHVVQSMVTISGGGPAGRGLGHGLQKFGYLPEDTTDFLLSVICEEMGLAGASIIVLAICAILLAGLKIMQREPEPVMKLFALGALATFGMQAIINIAVVTGWAPTKGIPLPLVSSGGSGWLMTSAALGVLVGMDRASARREARERTGDWRSGDEPDDSGDELDERPLTPARLVRG